jgi:hypothetical protein
MMVFSAIYPLLLSPIEGRKQQSAAVLPNPSATKQQPQSCLFNRANQQPRHPLSDSSIELQQNKPQPCAFFSPPKQPSNKQQRFSSPLSPKRQIPSSSL